MGLFFIKNKMAVICLLLMASVYLSFSLSDKIIIYSFNDANTNLRSLKTSLASAGIKYIFYNMGDDNSRYQELYDKMQAFDRSIKGYSSPVADVNGNMVTSAPSSLTDLKPYFKKSDVNKGRNKKDENKRKSGEVKEYTPADAVNAIDIKYAIKRKDFGALKYFLGCGALPDVPYIYEYILKTSDGKEEMKSEKKYFLSDVFESTVLNSAERSEIMKLLLDGGAYPDIKNDRGLTILMRMLDNYGRKTSAEDMLTYVQMLLDHGADIEAVDYENKTPIFHAVYGGIIDAVKMLLQKGAKTDHKSRDGSNVLITAAFMDGSLQARLDMIKLLVESGADINNKGDYGSVLYQMAGSSSNLPLIKYLVSLKADVNTCDEDGRTPMNIAKSAGLKEIYEYLKENGGKMFAFTFAVRNDSPVCTAVIKKDLAAIKGFPADEYKKLQGRASDGVPAAPVHLAAEGGEIEVLKVLNDMGVSWNTPDRYNRTPLLYAVMRGNKKAVEFMIQNGADPNVSDTVGMSSYAYASCGNTQMLNLLLRSQFKPEGLNPILTAIVAGNMESVKKLIQFVKKPEPVMADFACEFGQTAMVKYLFEQMPELGAGAKDLNAKAQYNSKRYNEYENKNKLLLIPQRKTGGIADKKGYFPYVLEELSPYYTNEKYNIDLSKNPVYIYVPAGYDGTKPFGLMVFASWNYPDEEYRKVLDKYNIIWVGYNCYNIEYKPFENDRQFDMFYLAVVYNMLKYFSIDQSRIWMAGMSWGGRVTGRVIVNHPDIFSGGISMGGCQADYIWNSDKKEFFDCMDLARKKLTLVITAGDFDFNRPEAYAIYNWCLMRNFKKIFYIQEPGKYHEALSGTLFEKAVNYLESNRN